MAMDLSFLEVGGAMWPLLNWLCFVLGESMATGVLSLEVGAAGWQC